MESTLERFVSTLEFVLKVDLQVMCGMVGTKRFKFDVFSNDVNLANDMESTGVAGRVHISAVTASYLDNQYILEEGPEHKSWFLFGKKNNDSIFKT